MLIDGAQTMQATAFMIPNHSGTKIMARNACTASNPTTIKWGDRNVLMVMDASSKQKWEGVAFLFACGCFQSSIYRGVGCTSSPTIWVEIEAWQHGETQGCVLKKINIIQSTHLTAIDFGWNHSHQAVFSRIPCCWWLFSGHTCSDSSASDRKLLKSFWIPAHVISWKDAQQGKTNPEQFSVIGLVQFCFWCATVSMCLLCLAFTMSPRDECVREINLCFVNLIDSASIPWALIVVYVL